MCGYDTWGFRIPYAMPILVKICFTSVVPGGEYVSAKR